MNILFIDNKNMKNNIRISLLENMAHHDVTLINDYENAIIFYKEKRPKMVLIDFENDFGTKALNKILEINPHQHIITLSDSTDCSEIIGCDHCLNNYKKRRILKSEGINSIIYMVDNFEYMMCAYANKLNQPKN